jgi:hypothetical protein
MARRDGYLYNPYRVEFYDRLVSKTVFNFLEKYGKNESSRAFLRHLPINFLAFFLIVGLFTFGPGYQPIALLFVPALAVLIGYTRSAPSFWHLILIAYPAVVFGTFFAYAGTFSTTGGPWNNYDTWWMLLVSCLYGLVILIVTIMDRSIANFSDALLPFVEIFFAFPFIWTGAWTFIGRVSPFGDFFNWGVALALIGVDDLTVGVTWMFGALPGGCFVTAVLVSCFLYCIRRYFEVCYPMEPPTPNPDSFTPPPLEKITDIRIPFLHPILLMVYAFAVFFGFGSVYRQFAPSAGQFYQNPLSFWAPSTVQMSCLINASYPTTVTHMETAGIDSTFVMWSADSVTVNDEQQFLNDGLRLSTRYGKYLGVSYVVPVTNSSRYTMQEKFALLVPPTGNQTNATIGFVQQRIHPMPIIDSGSEPGPRTFQYIDTPYGRVGGAIGSDFDFLTFANTYYTNIGIMLQPAVNYGPIGEYAASITRLRSLENGFTTVRCTENGVSGVFDPFYRILLQLLTEGAGESFVYQVPVLGKRPTLVRFFLDYVGIMSMAILIFWIILLSGWWIKRFNRRVRGLPPQDLLGVDTV